MAANLIKLKNDLARKQKTRTQIDAVLLHRKGTRSTSRALLPGVLAMSLERWLG
jgi:hypothetical protein